MAFAYPDALRILGLDAFLTREERGIVGERPCYECRNEIAHCTCPQLAVCVECSEPYHDPTCEPFCSPFCAMAHEEYEAAASDPRRG